MLMTGYTKLFGSIVASTIWREDDKTRIVWITMLAIANKHGEVEASVPGLADLARVSVSECRAALEKLSAPDPDSRSMEYEGRRIEKVEGGWRLINHAKYREKLSTDERREYLAQKQREHRARQQMSTSVKPPKQESTPSTHTEAEAETKEEAETNPLPTASAGAELLIPDDGKGKKSKAKGTIEEFRAFAVELGLLASDGDARFYALESTGWKVGNKPVKDWKMLMRQWKSSGYHPSQRMTPEQRARAAAAQQPAQPSKPKDTRTQEQRWWDYVLVVDARGETPMDQGAWFRAGEPEN